MGYKSHESAIVEDASIGEGTHIWHFAHVRTGAKIGKGCNIGKGVYIDTDVVIGDKVKIQNFVSVYKGVTIEDDVFVGPSATFTNDLYPRAFHWDESDLVDTLVQKGASIGANATIICGVSIGRYAMIGAGSVVTDDVKDHSLVLGSPARHKGYVCFCGRRLTNRTDENDERDTYKCQHCGKIVEIRPCVLASLD
jgi:UDP-2-acetamido-3-amino-2,3-dideoxy-glucuronate N-acetyltransferase